MSPDSKRSVFVRRNHLLYIFVEPIADKLIFTRPESFEHYLRPFLFRYGAISFLSCRDDLSQDFRQLRFYKLGKFFSRIFSP